MVHDVVLQRLAQFDEICAVARHADQQILVVLRPFQCIGQGFLAEDIKLTVHAFAGEVDISQRNQIITADITGNAGGCELPVEQCPFPART